MHKNRFYLLGSGSGAAETKQRRMHERSSRFDPEFAQVNPPTKFISLFSGAMGLDLGLESAGFEIAGCLELDKKACATIKANRPDIPVICGNIKDWSGPDLLKEVGVKRSDIAFIAGGPLCPSFSTAGKRQAFNDPRGQVMFDYLRIVKEISPPFFIMENVRGILSASLSHVPLSNRKGKKDPEKGSVLRLLNDTFATMGYTVTAELVNAANYGTPQKRERVVFLGSREGHQITMPIGGYEQHGSLFCQPWRTLGDALRGLNDNQPEFIPYSQKRSSLLPRLKPGESWRQLPKDLQREALGGAYDSTGGRVGFFRRLSFDEPSPTVPTSPCQKSTCLCHPTEIRPLSVKEYARIQQFPDDWIFVGSTIDKYRQIGNAVPVGLGYAIGRTLKRYIQNRETLEAENESDE